MLPSLIYIMARGHSGSTILDLSRANALEIASVGEFVSGADCYDGLCACGQEFRDCDFWKEARSRFEGISQMSWGEVAELPKYQTHVKCFPPTLLGRSGSAWIDELRMVNSGMIRTIALTSGRSYVVGFVEGVHPRSLSLARHVPKARIHHLVRHPERVLASHFWRIKRGEGFRFLRRSHLSKRCTSFFLTKAAIAWGSGISWGR